MVGGIRGFRDWFSGYENQYVIIGGTACDLVLSDEGMNFRATKDIDMVLIVEAITPEFCHRFWKYVEEAGYEHRNRSTGNCQFYRFSHPSSEDWPFMIELFSRKPDGLILPDDAVLTPLSVSEEVSSLSAILLDDDYYEFMRSGIRLSSERIPVLGPAFLIPFKVKAWLDLSSIKASGEHVDSRDIRKHKNDVFRLSVLLDRNEHVYCPTEVFADMTKFIELMRDEDIDLRALGIRSIRKDDIISMFSTVYIEK